MKKERSCSVLINDKYYNLNKIAILIERAIPKKVFKKRLHGLYGNCPKCGAYLPSDVYGTHFCPVKDCGQALDWSDEE